MSLTILVAGDWAPIRAFDPIIRRSPEAIYGDTLPRLRQADLRLVNCEAALTSAESGVWKSGAVFKGEAAHVEGLRAVPFDVACLANNHVLDYGVRGLRDTLRTLRRAGVRTVGAGLTPDEAYAPLALDVKGQAVHVVNISEGEDETAARRGAGVFGWDVPRAVDTIERSKEAGALVVVVAHCGLEYVPFAPPYVVDAFRAFADAGADAVIGHHPHVPQGVEWRGRTPIVYSLGNFVFYQPTTLYHRKVGYFVTLDCVAGRVAHVDLHPYRITENGLRMLDARESAAFLKTLSRLSAPYRTANGHLKAWEAYLDFYGTEGFSAEVSGILARMATEPQKAAAMFRNRISTAQHVELWRTFLTRVMAGTAGRSPKDARALVAEYFTRTL